MGMQKENTTVADSRGVVWAGREPDMEPNKAEFARETELRTLEEAVNGADIILGCSAPGILTTEMLNTIAENRSEEHTSELQSRGHLVCHLQLETKKHTQEENKQ